MTEAEQIYSLHQQLIKSDLHIFPEKWRVNISVKPGVYIIYSPANEVLHVGRVEH